MATTTDHELLTISEAAHLLRVDRSTIRRWINGGRLPAERIGERTIRIRRSVLFDAAPSSVATAGGTPVDSKTSETEVTSRMDDETRQRLLQAVAHSRQRRLRDDADPPIQSTAPPAWVLINESRDERSGPLAR